MTTSSCFCRLTGSLEYIFVGRLWTVKQASQKVPSAACSISSNPYPSATSLNVCCTFISFSSSNGHLSRANSNQSILLRLVPLLCDRDRASLTQLETCNGPR